MNNLIRLIVLRFFFIINKTKQYYNNNGIEQNEANLLIFAKNNFFGFIGVKKKKNQTKFIVRISNEIYCGGEKKTWLLLL